MGALLTMMGGGDAPPLNPTWSELVESPTGTSRALTSVSTDMVYRGRLYAVKSWSGSARQNDAAYFDIAAGGWVTGATDSGGSAVRYASAARVGAKIYCIGGDTSSGSTIAAVRIYDADANSWSGGANLPSARNGASCGVDFARNDIYICGGRDGVGAYTATIYRYDIDGNSWSQTTGISGASIPNAPVTAAFGAAFVSGTWLYYYPGWDAGLGAPSATIYKLDMSSASPSWTSAGTHPSPADLVSAYASDESLYLYGGYNGSAWVNQGYRYDAASETFTALNAMAGGGVISGWMGLHNGKLYAGAGRATTAYTQDVQEGV